MLFIHSSDKTLGHGYAVFHRKKECFFYKIARRQPPVWTPGAKAKFEALGRMHELADSQGSLGTTGYGKAHPHFQEFHPRDSKLLTHICKLKLHANDLANTTALDLLIGPLNLNMQPSEFVY